MKTLKQWYDELGEEAQLWVDNNCSTWFDKSQPDYYRKEVVNDLAHFMTFDEDINRLPKYSTSSCLRYYSTVLVKTMRYLVSQNMLSEKTFQDNLASMLNRDTDDVSKDVWLYDSERKLDTFVRLHQKRGYNSTHWLQLKDYLYLVTDFDNIQLPEETLNHNLGEDLDITVLSQLLGKTFALSWAKENCLDFVDTLRHGIQNDIFDELFFCENGWTDEQKKHILDRMYVITRHYRHDTENNLIRIADFMERIVSVDKSYLKFLYRILNNVPAMGNKMYEQKKEGSELTGNESIPQTYRYPKDIRKLARIINICIRKSLSNVNAAALKEISPLIKIYGYNFKDIYAALYPDHINAIV